MKKVASAIIGGLLLIGASPVVQSQSPDLIIYNARIWTAEDAQPWAEAIALRGDRILAVGSSRDLLKLGTSGTQLADLRGRMVTPGFIDAHTHFENATDWFYEVRLIDVDDEKEMLARLKETVRTVPAGMWITGVEWGGRTAKQEWSKGKRNYAAFQPTLAAIDAISGDHPVMFKRHDGAVFANSAALARIRYVKNKPDPNGGMIGRDATTGELNGMAYGTAATIAWTSLPPKNMARTLIAARAILKQLNSVGITGIHDIARIDELTQDEIWRTDVERSHSNMRIFTDLRKEGSLSVRVYPLLTLRDFRGLARIGITPGSGDDLIRYGALKAFIDGFMTFQPWHNRPTFSGDFTYRVTDEATMRQDVIDADRAGFDVGLHAFGDKAHWLMLNWYEDAIKVNPQRDRRFRLIHAWWPTLNDIKRAGKIGAVADITPIHEIHGWEQAEAVLGEQGAKTAFAWRTLIDNGVRVSIGSDFPGDYDKTEVSPVAPLENMYYAITRHKIGETASKAWHPDQVLTITEALKAYTINPAWSAHEDSIKGSLKPGKLADIVVLSQDITKGGPERLLKTRVIWTLLGGKTVYGGTPVN